MCECAIKLPTADAAIGIPDWFILLRWGLLAIFQPAQADGLFLSPKQQFFPNNSLSFANAQLI
ncbi:MAG: hypothetical protein F6K54_01535 [Okeania sp. SIO3B5]|uniref:hypothetical protein n=1 Tax=Okeania sp. SIO3B5 TaxID=2607811 RepID=UPI0013FF71D4|nr:hypothetical protein [Okeania sp. SIO3B5]